MTSRQELCFTDSWTRMHRNRQGKIQRPCPKLGGLVDVGSMGQEGKRDRELPKNMSLREASVR